MISVTQVSFCNSKTKLILCVCAYYMYKFSQQSLTAQDATVNFRILKEEEQAAKHILNNKFVGAQAENAVLAIRDCPIKRATLCVTSDPEMDKCVKMRVSTLRSSSPSAHV